MDLNKVKQKFNQHPESNGMTYIEHLQHAWLIGFKTIGAGLVLIIHGTIPFIFEHDGTNMLKDIVDDIKKTEKKQ